MPLNGTQGAPQASPRAACRGRLPVPRLAPRAVNPHAGRTGEPPSPLRLSAARPAREPRRVINVCNKLIYRRRQGCLDLLGLVAFVAFISQVTRWGLPPPTRPSSAPTSSPSDSGVPGGSRPSVSGPTAPSSVQRERGRRKSKFRRQREIEWWGTL